MDKMMRIHPSKVLLLAAGLFLAVAGCTDTLVEPKSSVTEANVFDDPNSYIAFLAKLYAGLAVTGQQGPHGQPDIQGIDEGFSNYIRGLFQMQELPTEEAVMAWNDIGLPELNTQLWASSNVFITAFYARIFFQVTQANEFLRQTTNEKLAERGQSDLETMIRPFRAEARFLRALSYWHALDHFGDVPLVDENFVIGSTPPEQSTREEIFNWVLSELDALQGDLPGPGMGEYGRADQGAVGMLRAKLHLNAEAYGVGAQYASVITALNPILNAYQLDDVYHEMFLADNHLSPEFIFVVPQDGLRTRTWGGTTFIAHAATGGNMNAADYGLDFTWWGMRVTQHFVALFPGDEPENGPDKRAHIFFTDGQNLIVTSPGNWSDGYAAPKYQNVTSGGAAGSDPTHPDTDFPVFRLSDAYLMYAEANLRGGGGSAQQALDMVNAIRMRAYGDASGNITAGELTLDFILDERARELFWEAHRRTDLVRFNQFTENGIWAWKGNAADGRTTDKCRDLYPIPAQEMIANPNMVQNDCY